MKNHNVQTISAVRLWAVLLLLSLLVSCASDQGQEQWMAIPENCAEEDIIVGVAWPFSVTQPQIWEGLTMARDEINDAGGVLGARICLWRQDDQSSERKGRLIAQQFADHADQVAAVIGHYNSSVSIPLTSTGVSPCSWLVK